MTRRARSDSGSATVWLLACGALLLTLAVITGVRSTAVLARHRAESAADLAALAGAGQIGINQSGICPAARRIAGASRAVMRACDVSLDASGRSGTVRVRVVLHVNLPIIGDSGVTASARAGRMPVPP